MRKMNPADVKSDFSEGLSEISTFYDNARKSLAGDKDKTLLAESAFLSAAVLWEGFVSDLFIALINRDCARFVEHLQNAMNSNLTNKQQTILADYGSLNIPKHLTKESIAKLIDPIGGNISFVNFAAMVDAAQSWITPALRVGMETRSAPEQATVNAAIAIRNHLAHRSERSHATMNSAIDVGALHGTGLRRSVNHVNHPGAYLKARPQGQALSRLKLYLSALDAVAGQL